MITIRQERRDQREQALCKTVLQAMADFRRDQQAGPNQAVLR
jgi:hypothetical protein